ncbi:SDR family oxidoreductase [Ellagibacter isourolithinifaciens]|uniref:SDR family oxidoreductase n=1 Tax=Ellagibacter isourolithinifaciens TaxID=2137581 RepID=A0A6N6NQR8_9ACTN|nr:NAD-dependent epimerase/dehydratase family protein [Ellagibacter isourolithinifaciens]KAB1640224.1 SDR family oxidoreductase [Ellagibacter isourolithinifaciens]
MKVLVTGANGFVGRNLCEALRNIAEGKDRRGKYQSLLPLTVYEYDRNGTQEELSFYCSAADFVFNLAGINRPKDPSEFMKGNMEFGETLLSLLEHHGNKCPVMLSSSVQASLEGRYAGSPYGESKLAGEELLFDYEERTGAKAMVYRFPNLYGKWCRPRYNSAVATFCDAIANDREFQVNDPSVELELLYIDDLVTAMLDALVGDVRRCRYAGAECVPAEDGRYCYAPGAQKASLGEIVGLLKGFRDARETLAVPNLGDGSFSKKLYSTFLSYYEPGRFAYSLKPNVDARGSFTEFLRTPDRGQISVNVSKPGITKGNHWHMSKWEKFLVVSGTAKIKLRKVGADQEGNPYPVDEYVVTGGDMRVVEMIPGYTHSITNLSDDEDLVTVMWANEPFDPENPDTYYDLV